MANYLDSRRIMGTSSEKPKVFSTGCKAYYNAEIITTLDEDFSSYADQTSANNTWIRTNTSSDNVRANATTDVLDCINDNTVSTTIDTVYYDLGSALSDTAWVCRFTLDLTSFTPRSDTNTQFSSFRIASTTGVGSSAQDSMGLNLYTHTGVGNKYEAVAQDNGAFDFYVGGASSDTLSVETKYVEMIRNGDTLTVKFYNNSSYGSVVESFSDTQTGVTGLRYVKAHTRKTVLSNNGIISFTVDDIKIYNGVTSVSDSSFTNKATTDSGFADGLGSSANGTNSGVTTTTGKLGSYAWSFSGSDSNVWINHTLSHSAMSVSVWVYPTTISGQHTIFIDDPNNLSTGSNMDLVLNSSGYFQFETYNAGWQSLNSTTTASVNNWYHVVVTEDGTDRKIYVNGSLENTSSVVSSSLNTGIRIGGDGYGGGVVNEFIGKIDELSFFNRVLTADEVSTLYNSGTGLAVPTNDLNVETNSIFIETDTTIRYWFDGSEWQIPYLAGASTGFSAGGSTSLWTANTNHETYNGSTWSSATALTAGRQRITGVGGSSNHLVAGGDTSGTTNTQTTTYVWNGSSWSTGGALSQKRQFNPIGGTTTNTIVMGGETPEISQPNQLNSVESYNGTSWTTEASMSAASSGHSGSGTRQNAWWAGGYTHPNYLQTSQEYNGTAWTTRTSLPAKRANNAGGVGFKDSSLFTAGYDGVSVYQTTTYFYDGTAWSTKGAFPIGSGYVHMGGNPDNALQTSAYYNTWYQTNAYKFNGSTWSSTGSRSTGTTTGACGGG